MPSDDTHIYLFGTVGATMKKRNYLTFQIFFCYPTFGIDKKNKTGDPVKSHCECLAGKGPHGTCISMFLQFYYGGELCRKGKISSKEMV